MRILQPSTSKSVGIHRRNRVAPKIEKSFAGKLFRNAADEMAAKMPPYRNATLMVTVYSPEEVLASKLAAKLALAMKYLQTQK